MTTRLVVLYWGLPGTGKTFYSLTFPRPLRYHNFDLNSEHLLQGSKLLNPVLRRIPGEVKEYRYAPYKPMMDIEEASEILDRFGEQLSADVKELGEGTIVIDTLTSFQQLVSKVTLDKVEQKRGFLIDKESGKYKLDAKGKRIPNPAFEIYPFDYAARNEIFKNAINVGKAKEGLNIVCVAQAKEIYNEKGRPTGKFEVQVPDMTPYLVQLNLHAILNEGVFMAEVDKWSFNSKRVGDVLEDPSYKPVLDLVKKDTEA